MANERRIYFIQEVCQSTGLRHEFVIRAIRAHWVRPAWPEQSGLDEEDLARLQLIRELQEELGVNDEAIPIILHLLDQLHSIQSHLRRAA